MIASAFRSTPDPSDVAVFEEVRRAVKESQSGTASAGGGMLVLDVRRPREREMPGRIPGTKNVPCKTLNSCTMFQRWAVTPNWPKIQCHRIQ